MVQQARRRCGGSCRELAKQSKKVHFAAELAWCSRAMPGVACPCYDLVQLATTSSADLGMQRFGVIRLFGLTF